MTTLLGQSTNTTYTTLALLTGAPNTCVYLPFVASTSGVANTLNVYLKLNSYNTNFKPLIADAAKNILAVGAQISPGGVDGWYSSSISNVNITSGQTYHLGFYFDASDGAYGHWAGAATNSGVYVDTTSGSFATPPATLAGSVRTDVYNFAIYASGSLTSPTLTTPPSSLVAGSSVTIAGTNLGASGGTVTVGGVSATVTAQSATSVTFTVNLGSQKYGSKTVVYTRASDSATTSFTATLVPASGYAYVDLTSLQTAANRITALPDLAIGDELEYQTIGGKVTVNADASFSTTDETVTSFSVRANDGTGWGSSGTQTVSYTDTQAPTTPNAPVFVSDTATSVTVTLGGGTDNVGVTGYNVYRGGTKITSSPVAAGNYTATGLAAITTYSFTATAVDAAGNESPQSGSLVVTTTGGGRLISRAIVRPIF